MDTSDFHRLRWLGLDVQMRREARYLTGKARFPLNEDILRAYEKGFADALESAAVAVETGYGYMTVRDMAKRIRALAKHIQPPSNPPSVP